MSEQPWRARTITASCATVSLQLTSREMGQIVDLYVYGFTMQHIANTYGTYEAAVRRVLAAEDVPIRPAGWRGHVATKLESYLPPE